MGQMSAKMLERKFKIEKQEEVWDSLLDKVSSLCEGGCIYIEMRDNVGAPSQVRSC